MIFFLWKLDSFVLTLLTAKVQGLLSMLLGRRRSGIVFCMSLFSFFLFPLFSYANVEKSAVEGLPLTSSESHSSEGASFSSNETNASKKTGNDVIVTEETPIDVDITRDANKSGDYSDEIEMRLNGASDASSYTWNILRLIFSLLFVLLLAYVAIRLMRRSRLFVPNDDAYLKLVANLNIEQGKSIKVFTLGDKAYVIGVTATNIAHIAELDDQVLIDAMNLKADENTMARSSSFAKVFSNMFSPNRRARQKKLEDAIFDDSFLKKQQERLNNINIKEEKEDEGD